MDNKSKSLSLVIEQGMLPLFFHPSETVTLNITRTLYEAGIKVVEYTNRGKEALNNFAKLKEEAVRTMPGLQLGIGTIKTAEEARQFVDAGADFIVAPTVNPEVAAVANENGLLWVPGCMTPTEIALAQQNGAALIKIFPANILGTEFVSSIKDLFAGQAFMPTGGVDLTQENISSWFKAGVVAVGMGSKLVSKEILANEQYDVLKKNTVDVLNVIQACRVK